MLKNGIFYWECSLKYLENLSEKWYVFDEIIINDEELIKRINHLRELINSYCCVKKLIKKSKENTHIEKTLEEIVEEIYKILLSVNNIQYNEFIAFWKTQDISFSSFKSLKKVGELYQKDILDKLIDIYCERRKELYDKLGYTDVIIQSLYDNGTSRKQGNSATAKLQDIINSKLNAQIVKANNLKEWETLDITYILPDSGDQELFEEITKKYKIQFKFKKERQNKYPDLAFKYKKEIFILEAKHIKESGGEQDKSIQELISFIKQSEKSENIHYVSFMDGIYFNVFVYLHQGKINGKNARKKPKYKIQFEEIKKTLKKNPQNFFVNTRGFIKILEDLEEK